MRTKKETGYTLVYISGTEIKPEHFATEDALKKSIADEPPSAGCLLFAGNPIPFSAATQTIVTIGVPATRKGKQQPVKASELPKKERRKAAGPGLKADGSPRKPRTVKPKVVADPVVVRGANGEQVQT